MSELLSVKGDSVSGELALDVAPGTTATERDRRVDALLAGELAQAADRLGAVLAAPPHRFAKPLPGKDDEGRTRFTIRGRAEGGRLIPDHSAGKTRRR